MRKHSIASLIIISIVLILTGCATSTIIVKPDVHVVQLPKQSLLKGKVDYDKTNKDYLPTMIESGNTNLTLRYRYTVMYNTGGVDNDAFNLFNPLLFVGFPISESDLLVSGRLTVLKYGKVLETFESSCVAKDTRNLFDTAGSSEDRKKCLLKIRYNIDAQISNKYQKRNEQ